MCGINNPTPFTAANLSIVAFDPETDADMDVVTPLGISHPPVCLVNVSTFLTRQVAPPPTYTPTTLCQPPEGDLAPSSPLFSAFPLCAAILQCLVSLFLLLMDWEMICSLKPASHGFGLYLYRSSPFC